MKISNSILATAISFTIVSCDSSTNSKNILTSSSDTSFVAAKEEETKISYGNTSESETENWMPNNLDVDKFRNGDPIPHAKSDQEWNDATDNEQPAWCYYKNDPQNGEKYGKLYNWYAVIDPRGLAPSGWHVPSIEEWTQLTDYLIRTGKKNEEGNRMKSIEGWEKSNNNYSNGNNLSGFSALPGGLRRPNGFFEFIGKYGFWWSSTEDERAGLAWEFSLRYEEGYSRTNSNFKALGLSVRCVRD